MESEIILIGNELLIGKVQDTNGKFIIDHLIPLGMQITQITIIPDDLLRIRNAVLDSLTRKPMFIFTSGGLGPTFDDMTLEGINQILKPFQEMKENADALEMIYQSYSKRFKKSTKEVKSFLEKRYPLHHKMAILPQCAIPLNNSEGMAPGVLIPKEFTNGVTEIIALPGVPLELEAIFVQHIVSRVQKLTRDIKYYQCGFIFANLGESRFTELIYSIKDKYPEIWIKTHPRSKLMNGKRIYEVEVHLTAFTKNKSIPNKINELYNILKEHVQNSRGKILKENPLLE
ncbi:MAG: hypothetical protein DRO88_08705 [Promethearchaeia archaeon]|nr:MAG: hypothetical protein DRO88_08705 [Candidatus Lokiarchaeia archaeon]